MHNNDIAMDTDNDGDDYNCMDKKELWWQLLVET